MGTPGALGEALGEALGGALGEALGKGVTVVLPHAAMNVLTRTAVTMVRMRVTLNDLSLMMNTRGRRRAVGRRFRSSRRAGTVCDPGALANEPWGVGDWPVNVSSKHPGLLDPPRLRSLSARGRRSEPT